MNGHIEVFVDEILPKLSDMIFNMRIQHSYGQTSDLEHREACKKYFSIEFNHLNSAITNYLTDLYHFYDNLDSETLNILSAYNFNKNLSNKNGLDE